MFDTTFHPLYLSLWNSYLHKIINVKPKPPGPHDIDIKTHYVVFVEVMSILSPVDGESPSCAQVGSCLDCYKCKNGNEQHCNEVVYTYNFTCPDGTITYGGYSTAIHVHELFAFPVPDNMKLGDAASLFCAGLAVFSPLKRYGAGPGKRVGLVGLGGLGHFTVQFARALGCEEVVVFSHSSRKKDDAMKLGATRFNETSKEGFETSLRGTLNLIIMIIVGLPDDALPPIKSVTLVASGILIGGSSLGSRAECLEMLEVASKHKVKP
ncbi:hypothetical protein BJ165DRAFT_1397433 [Panaeolus papilionaceus]|nr:hypothetical protein BJ165DRAFT_1397433 [Panaeolus papilionaceus]